LDLLVVRELPFLPEPPVIGATVEDNATSGVSRAVPATVEPCPRRTPEEVWTVGEPVRVELPLTADPAPTSAPDDVCG
jgi:hypothetical protein